MLLRHTVSKGYWNRTSSVFAAFTQLAQPLCAIEIIKRTQQAGVMALAGDPFFAERPTGQFLRLAFSYVTPAKIAEGIKILGKALVTGG